MFHEEIRVIKELLDLYSEAQSLADYRKNVNEYQEKCGNLVARIKVVCNSLNVSDLSDEQKSILLKLNHAIINEQMYAESAFELRKPVNWKDE